MPEWSAIDDEYVVRSVQNTSTGEWRIIVGYDGKNKVVTVRSDDPSGYRIFKLTGAHFILEAGY